MNFHSKGWSWSDVLFIVGIILFFGLIIFFNTIADKHPEEEIKTYSEGYDEGYDEGEYWGYREGFDDGYKAGEEHIRDLVSYTEMDFSTYLFLQDLEGSLEDYPEELEMITGYSADEIENAIEDLIECKNDLYDILYD